VVPVPHLPEAVQPEEGRNKGEPPAAGGVPPEGESYERVRGVGSRCWLEVLARGVGSSPSSPLGQQQSIFTKAM
jgi:hypothetical protein